MTPPLTFKTQFEIRYTHSRLAITTIWQNIFNNNDISVEEKFKIFNTPIRSIVFYASRVWGGVECKTIETLWRGFIKKLFRLAKNIPGYMSHLDFNVQHNIITLFHYLQKDCILSTYRRLKNWVLTDCQIF